MTVKDMTVSEWKRFATLARTVEVDPVADYSGRGMFGSTCIGIIGDEEHLHEFRQDWGDVYEFLALAPSRDSMGLRTILYWPSRGVEGGHRFCEDCDEPRESCECE